MYTIQKAWKEFNISVPSLEAELRANFPQYAGCSANTKLELHFIEEPSQEEKDDIDSYYESLDGSGYVSRDDMAVQEAELEAAITAAKAEIVTKSWDEMSMTERKIAVGLKPTRSEMELE